MVDFKVSRCSQQTYDNIQEKDPDKLYFCRDTGNIYLGNIRCGGKDILQPDWNQNEESETNFIKHRTHWKEAVSTDYSSDMSFTQVYSGVNTDDGGKMDYFDYGYAKFDVVNQDPESFYDRPFHRNSEAEDSEDYLQGTISWYNEVETGFFEFYDSENNIIAILVTDDYHPQETPFSILLDTGYPSPYSPSSGLTGLYVLNAINGSVNDGEVEGIFDFFVEHETVYHVISKLYLPPVEWNEIEGRTHGIEAIDQDKTIVDSSEFTDDTEYCIAVVDDLYTSCYRQFLFVYEDGLEDELYGSLKLRHAGSTEFIDCSEGIPPYNNGDLLLYGNPYLYDNTLDDNGELYVMFRVFNEQDSQWTIKVDSEFMYLEGLTELDITDISAIKKLDKVYLPSDVIKWLTQPDWNQSDSSKPDFIKNKPDIPTKTSDLINDGDSSYPNDPFVRQSEIKQANWEQNNENEPDYIENRTHYEEILGRAYKNTDPDYEYVEMPEGASTFDVEFAYYANETFESINELENRTLTIVINGGTDVYELTSVTDNGTYWTAGYGDDEGIVVYVISQTTIDDKTFEPGLYILAGTFGVTAESYELTEHNYLKQLDEKYIPSTIARTANIPIVDQTYNGSSSNAVSGVAVSSVISPIQEVIPSDASSSNQLVDTNTLEDRISPIEEVIPGVASSENQLVDHDTLIDAIQQQVSEYISSDISMVVPFENCTNIGNQNSNLENGPWYRDGVECGSGGSDSGSDTVVYVTENDYAVVLNDESVCYFEAYGYRYQRHKDGGASSFGYVVLPDANHTQVLIQYGEYDQQNVLYFIDTSHVFSQDDIVYVVSSLTVLQDSVLELTSLSDVTPVNTYDLHYPTTRYVCTSSQTADTPPVWSFAYTVNDSALTGAQMRALNSGITQNHVSKIDNLATVATTGSYNDLIDKPTIPTLVQPDWEETDTESYAYILNKPSIKKGGTSTSIVEGNTAYNSSTADCSHAEGYSTSASGSYSHAEGSGTTASATASHAEGGGCGASGNYSHAEGNATHATEASAHAEGQSTTASGQNSHAEGSSTTAEGSQSHAEGSGTTASASQSHSEGYTTTASGDQSHAEGNGTTASATASHAEGMNSVASANQSHAEGNGTTAGGDYSHAEGNATISMGYGSHSEGYGSSSSLSLTYVSSGTFTISGDYSKYKNGYVKDSNGDYHQIANASYDSSTSLTTLSISLSDEADVTVYLVTGLASGVYSHSEGNANISSGMGSHAEGYTVVASGDMSHAEGNTTIASGGYSHAEGVNATASATGSHAEGNGTTASGYYGHAEGNVTVASGDSSHAEGSHTTASGNGSHASGYQTIANSLRQTVFGTFNVADNGTATSKGQYVEIVGNGTAEDARSNARTLDWDGNEVVAGTLTIGGSSGIVFKANSGQLLISLDGGTSWNTVTLTPVS